MPFLGESVDEEQYEDHQQNLNPNVVRGDRKNLRDDLLDAKLDGFAEELVPTVVPAVTFLEVFLPVDLLSERADEQVGENLHKVPKSAGDEEKDDKPSETCVFDEVLVV